MTSASSNTEARSLGPAPILQRQSLLHIIWMRREFALGIFILVMLMGASVLSFQPARYTAKSIFAYQPEEYEVRSAEDILRTPPSIQTFIEDIRTQVTSNEFLLPLIKAKRFDRRAAFNPALYPDNTLLTKWLEGQKPRDETRDNLPPEQRLNLEIADKIRKDLKIELTPEKTIQVSFTSVTPDVADKVSNAVINKLVQSQDIKGRKNILQEASTPESFSEPDIFHTLTLTGLLGLILGISLAYILGYIQIRKMGSGVCTVI